MLSQNLDYWEISLKNPEPIIDEYYTFDKLIVQNQNLIQKVERLRELITTYCVLLEIDKQALGKILDEIYTITLHDNIQYTEFIAFWKTLDLSYSSFRKLPEQDRKLMLHKILEEYCEKRKNYTMSSDIRTLWFKPYTTAEYQEKREKLEHKKSQI
jgi:hypothetical protein